MKDFSRLPEYLVTRYKDWKTGLFLEKQEKHARLAGYEAETESFQPVGDV